METNVIFLSDYRFALRRCANSNRGVCEFSSGGMGNGRRTSFGSAPEERATAILTPGGTSGEESWVRLGDAARRALWGENRVIRHIGREPVAELLPP